MTRFDRSPLGGDSAAGGVLPTIEECRELDPDLRRELELVDYEVRRVVNHLLAGVDRSGKDGALFLRASTTVLLSIAAGLMETAADRSGARADIETFRNAADDAARWAKDHKLRHFVEGEG